MESGVTHDVIHVSHECVASRCILPQEAKGRRLFANLSLMQDRGIVAKIFEFKPTKGRLDFVGINRFLEDAEYKRKDWELRINRSQSMVSAFISKYNIIAKSVHAWDVLSMLRKINKHIPARN